VAPEPITPVTPAAPEPVTPAPTPTPPVAPEPTDPVAPQNQVKPALIAIAMFIILQFICFNTMNFNVLASGIYLGVEKNVGKKTNLIFYFTIAVFLIINDILFKNGLSDPERGAQVAFLVTVLGGALGATFPLGVAWVTRKIKNRTKTS